MKILMERRLRCRTMKILMERRLRCRTMKILMERRLRCRTMKFILILEGLEWGLKSDQEPTIAML
jgi:hypothetical protein